MGMFASAFALISIICPIIAIPDHGHADPGDRRCFDRHVPLHFPACTRDVYQTLTKKIYNHAHTTTITYARLTPLTYTATVKTTVDYTTTTIEMATVTVTATITTAGTFTVSSASAFIPVQSSLPGSTYDGVGKRSLQGLRYGPRIYGRPHYPHYKGDNYDDGDPCRPYRPFYGQCAVNSVIYWRYETFVMTRTIARYIYPYTTTTTTTSTDTITKVSTTTSTGTETATITVVSTTVFAACTTNNFASSFSGIPVAGVLDNGSNGNTGFAFAATVRQCCNAAFAVSAAFFYYDAGGSGNCVFNGRPNGECVPQTQNNLTAIAIPDNPPFVIGNGPCGEINSVIIMLKKREVLGQV